MEIEKNRDYYLQHLRPLLEPEDFTKDLWVIVNSDRSAYVCPTQEQALQMRKSADSYVGPISDDTT